MERPGSTEGAAGFPTRRMMRPAHSLAHRGEEDVRRGWPDPGGRRLHFRRARRRAWLRPHARAGLARPSPHGLIILVRLPTLQVRRPRRREGVLPHGTPAFAHPTSSWRSRGRPRIGGQLAGPLKKGKRRARLPESEVLSGAHGGTVVLVDERTSTTRWRRRRRGRLRALPPRRRAYGRRMRGSSRGR